jgi:hypothetical protein
MNNYLAKAIFKLKPNSEYSFSNNDYSTIKWDVLEGTAPTQAEINTAIEQVKVDEIIEATTRATAKAALLAQLGITEEQAKLLLS